MSASPAATLADVLAACVSVDNGKRKAGEDALKHFSKDGNYLQYLLECASVAPDVQVWKKINIVDSLSADLPACSYVVKQLCYIDI
jgi:hypothetical protein